LASLWVCGPLTGGLGGFFLFPFSFNSHLTTATL
jgi:hypothetical protein